MNQSVEKRGDLGNANIDIPGVVHQAIDVAGIENVDLRRLPDLKVDQGIDTQIQMHITLMRRLEAQRKSQRIPTVINEMDECV